MSRRLSLRALGSDARGATIVEFALVVPPLRLYSIAGKSGRQRSWSLAGIRLTLRS